MPVDGRGGERVRFWDRLGLAGIEGQCLVEAKIALGRAVRGRDGRGGGAARGARGPRDIGGDAQLSPLESVIFERS